jgi:hypothetical protein
MEETFKKETSNQAFIRMNGIDDGLNDSRVRAAAGASHETGRPWKETFKRLIALEKSGRISRSDIEKLAKKGIVL